jgi:CRP-like cAMP-binding protein
MQQEQSLGNENKLPKLSTNPNRINQSRRRRAGLMVAKLPEEPEELCLAEKQIKQKQVWKDIQKSMKKEGLVRGIGMYLSQKMDLKKISMFKKSSEKRSKKSSSWAKSYNEGDSEEEASEEEESEDERFEDDDEELKEKFACLVNPEGTFKFYWDHFHILCVSYIILFVPFKFSFLNEELDSLEMLVIGYAVDAFFFIDIVLNFFTPIYIKHELITDHKIIAKQYFKFWFWLDLLSIFPFELLFDTVKSSYSIFIRITKIPRLWKVLRAAKLFRAFRVKKKNPTFLGKIWMFLKSKNAAFISLYFFSMIAAHVMACLWHFISWNTKDPQSWLIRYDYEHEPYYDRYWASVYYTYTTMTTTGYGDIVPETLTEKFLTSIYMFFGVLFYSWIYTTMLGISQKSKERDEVVHRKKQMLKELKRKDKMFVRYETLYRKMLHTIDWHHNQDDEAPTKFPEFHNVNPKDVKRLLLEILEKEYKFSSNIFFKSLADKNLWLKFYEHMEKRVYEKGDIIYERKSVATHFFVLRKGKVLFLLKEEDINEDEKVDNKTLYVRKPSRIRNQKRKFSIGRLANWAKNKLNLNQEEEEPQIGQVVKNLPFVEVDSYFGEFELFIDSLRTWTVIANSKVVVYTIPKRQFQDLFEKEAQHAPFLEATKNRWLFFEKAEKEFLEAIEIVDKRNKKRGSNETKVSKFQKVNKVAPVPIQRNISKFEQNSKPKVKKETKGNSKKIESSNILDKRKVKRFKRGYTTSMLNSSPLVKKWMVPPKSRGSCSPGFSIRMKRNEEEKKGDFKEKKKSLELESIEADSWDDSD